MPAQKYTPKWFCVAREGATTDGRTISRDWLSQMAATYNPATYGARINMEHIRGIVPDGPFRAYGDVMALQARDVGGKLCLFAQLSPTPDLVDMTNARQKVYTSIEVDPNFAKTGQAYLVGLAVTDSPASLGCDMLKFAAGLGDASPLASRKQSPSNLFTEAQEIDGFTFDTEDEDRPGLFAPVREKLAALFRKTQGQDKHFAELADTLDAVADHLATVDEQLADVSALAERLAKLEADVRTEREDHATTRSEFHALRDQLDNTPSGTRRPTATGGGAILTDC